MRYLLISDIHANIEALRSVLAHAARKRWDKMLFLGDAIGYAAAPNQVVERLRGVKKPMIGVRGNHDRVSLDPEKGAVFFNSHARAAAEWSGRTLTTPNRRWVERLQVGPRTIEPGLEICHGSPYDEDEYLFTENEAVGAFEASEADVIFFGHSHVPCMFEMTRSGQRAMVMSSLLRGSRVSIDLAPGRRYLINPGSVGQPRDRDPRAAYGLYDAGARRFTLFRVDYDIPGAQRRILAAGLPGVLAERLRHGA